MPKLFLLIAALVSCPVIFGQGFTLSGTVRDTSQQQNLHNATIMLLRQTDTTLAAFTRTNAKGSFSLHQVPAGKYLIEILYPGYAAYEDALEMKQTRQLGVIPMVLKATLLENVIVRGSPIRIKGDTTEYVADSFKTAAGARVEDLLRRLPGLQVNNKGEITTLGQKVEQILVDGEEFFAEDPQAVTKNLRADAIDKVQVYDEKSKQADLTGIDDGKRTKTVNLKLKENKKRGVFGNALAAGGLPDFWSGMGRLNYFNKKRKLGIYGGANNTGDGIGRGGDVYVSSGRGGGGGIPVTSGGGVQYNDAWDSGRSNIMSNYNMNNTTTNGGNSTIKQTILPDTQYFNTSSTRFRRTNAGKSASLSSSMNFRDTSTLQINANANLNDNTNYTRSQSEATNTDNVPVNTSDNTNASSGQSKNIGTNIDWRKRIRGRRTISVSTRYSFSESTDNGQLFVANAFYRNGVVFRNDTTDQLKKNFRRSNTVFAGANYTEPIGKSGSLQINYNYNFSNSRSYVHSFNKLNGKYELFDSAFSNEFTLINQVHNGGITYAYTAKKFNTNAGISINHNMQHQERLLKNDFLDYSFTNFGPQASLNYFFSKTKSMNVFYNGQSQAPGINQLQPVRDNTDPLNIYKGNPDLKRSFNHSVSMRYTSQNIKKRRSLNASLNGGITQNAISSFDRVDSVGVRTYFPVNVNGNYNINANAGYSINVKKLDGDINLGMYLRNSRTRNYINGLLNSTINTVTGINVSTVKYVYQKYAFDISSSVDYNRSTSSVRKDVVTQYLTGNVNLGLSVDAIKRLQVNTDANFQWRQRTSVFDKQNNVLIWRASMHFDVLKKSHDLKLFITINDILNQNVGFSRYISANYITENRAQVIGRFWLAGVKWDFSKN